MFGWWENKTKWNCFCGMQRGVVGRSKHFPPPWLQPIVLHSRLTLQILEFQSCYLDCSHENFVSKSVMCWNLIYHAHVFNSCLWNVFEFYLVWKLAWHGVWCHYFIKDNLIRWNQEWIPNTFSFRNVAFELTFLVLEHV